jgi:hypothetical protein
MEFSFEPSRDFFYLALLFLGAALGSFLNRFRRKCNKGFRNRSVVIAIIFLSGAVASLTVMLILSGGKFIVDPALFITGVVFALLALLSMRFPRTAGFSFMLLAGIGIVWVSYAFSRFPMIESQTMPLAYISGGQGELSIEFIPEKEKVSIPIPETHELELIITRIEYSYFFFFVGGESRGRITAIRDNETVIYEYPYFERSLRHWNSLFFVALEKHSMSFSMKTFQPGRVYRIFNDFGMN